MKVFLDDVRIPEDCAKYMHRRIGALNPLYLDQWCVCRSYEEFVLFVWHNIDNITHLSFDHDLGEDVAQNLIEVGVSKRQARKSKKLERTGYDAAMAVKRMYEKKGKDLPAIFVHSMNPVGLERIMSVFNLK